MYFTNLVSHSPLSVLHKPLMATEYCDVSVFAAFKFFCANLFILVDTCAILTSLYFLSSLRL